MESDKTEQPQVSLPRDNKLGNKRVRDGDAPQEFSAPDIDPATAAEEDDEGRLPELAEDNLETVAEGPLAIGHTAIENAVKLAPTSPGVYRMLNAAHDVLYVGKAKNVKKRL